ncbi:unnamed protein product [Cuscuta epithymum]|uniref:CCHC-type domain-containing protein n=1 Tax=Cuscuta epithymum TaxID=186058 RepID=A0AAV0CJE0_9ASTE|nr:unnamed protein product [Cuscuta epithymum]
MASNNFSISIPLFKGDNYLSWAIKMKAYMKAISLWDVIESDSEPTPLPGNPTAAQIKKHEEEMARKPKALSCIHAAVSEEIFTTIMGCECPKEAWEKIKEEFEGNQQTKLMQILNLKREFEMMGMKSNEGVKEYGNRLMSIVNQIKLLGGDFSSQRVVDKLLVTLPERYETKISSLEDTKDLSKLTVLELINSLHAVDQRRSMREEENGGKNEGLLLAKSSFSKGTGNKIQCNHCHKVGHEEKDCWHKGKPQCFKCKRFGHLAKNCRFQTDEEVLANLVEGEPLL